MLIRHLFSLHCSLQVPSRPRPVPARPLGAVDRMIADLNFPSFSTEDRAMVVETLTALKGTLVEALGRAAKRSTKLA